MEIAGHTVNGEVSRFGRFLKRLRSDYLGLLVLAGLFAAGASGGWAAHGLVKDAFDVPNKLERIDDRLARIEARLERADHQGTRSGIMIRAFCKDPPTEETREACSIVDFLNEQWERRSGR